MGDNNTKSHWQNIYATKQPTEVSWWQENPVTSLEFIRSFHFPKTAGIIDIGGGDSTLVDFLLADGFENITVLDISERALERAQQRLGNNAGQVRWIVSNVLDFQADSSYRLWHDRAAFHFLTEEKDVERYVSVLEKTVPQNGYVIIGTFSTNGPTKCSGLAIRQYDEKSLTERLGHSFERIRCVTEDHVTPFRTKQNFLFCSFRRRKQSRGR